MANENFPTNGNFRVGSLVGGLSSDEDGKQIVLRLDPTTKRLLVDATVSYTNVQNGEAVDAGDYGTLVLGTDGTNYRIIKTNTSGEVLVGFNGSIWSANDTETSAQTDKELVATPGSGLSLYITDIIVSNGATAGTILFEEDTASAKTVKVPKLYLGVNGGAVMNFKTPIKITANKNFGFTSATVTTHDILVNGYIAP